VLSQPVTKEVSKLSQKVLVEDEVLKPPQPKVVATSVQEVNSANQYSVAADNQIKIVESGNDVSQKVSNTSTFVMEPPAPLPPVKEDGFDKQDKVDTESESKKETAQGKPWPTGETHELKPAEQLVAPSKPVQPVAPTDASISNE